MILGYAFSEEEDLDLAKLFVFNQGWKAIVISLIDRRFQHRFTNFQRLYAETQQKIEELHVRVEEIAVDVEALGIGTRQNRAALDMVQGRVAKHSLRP